MNFARSVIELFVLVASFFVPNLVILPFPERTALLDSPFLLVLFTVAGAAQFVFMCVVALRSGRYARAELGLLRPGRPTFGRLAQAFFGICAIYFLIMIIVSMLPHGAQEWATAGYRWKLSDITRMPLILMFSLVVGYREEFLFRAYLLTFFTRSGSPLPVSLVLSATIFGVLHAYEGVVAIVFAAAAALFFSWMFTKYRDLHAIAIGHALFNAGLIFASLYVPV